jgi:hypothetical protein
MGRVPLALVCVVVAASLGAGCAKVQARIAPVEPRVALALPPPPPRVVEAYASSPEAAAPIEVGDTTATDANVPARSPVRPTPVAPALPETPAAAPPVEASEPSLVLRPAGSNQKAQDAIRSLLGQAARDLGRVNYQTLGPDARVQHDTARRFMQQAETALAAGNLMFAGKLADKAALMAAVLIR